MADSKARNPDTKVTSSVSLDALRGAVETAIPFLKVVHPDQLTEWFGVGSGGITVGRDRGADIVLKDKLVSRTHCRISVSPDGAMVEDLSSTNGTFVDGASVSTAPLATSNRIQLGSYLIRLEYKSPTEVLSDQQLVSAATTDGLTGVLNRRWFMRRGATELAALRDLDGVVGAVMLDIDYFKRVNDTYGHQAGDTIIRNVAQVFQEQKRGTDLLGRYGGEEFALLVTDVSSADAVAVSFCERLRSTVAESRFEFRGTTIPITVSIGVSTARGEELTSLDDLLGGADKALYQAKVLGRNRVVASS